MQVIERQVVILFTDIADYTGFTATRGNAAAMDLLHQHNNLVTPIIDQFSGTYVKSTGDGVIAYFDQPRAAVDAAVTIQQRLAAFNMARPEDQEIHIRVGLHVGSAVIEPGEILGQAVNFAARLVAVCKTDSCVISKDLYKKVKQLKHLAFRRIGYTSLQGIPERQEVFEVCWDIKELKDREKVVFHATAQETSLIRRHLWLRRAAIAVVAVLIIFQAVKIILAPKPIDEARKQFELARKYKLKGDDLQALAALDRAISLDRNFAEAYLQAALIYADI